MMKIRNLDFIVLILALIPAAFLAAQTVTVKFDSKKYVVVGDPANPKRFGPKRELAIQVDPPGVYTVVFQLKKNSQNLRWENPGRAPGDRDPTTRTLSITVQTNADGVATWPIYGRCGKDKKGAVAIQVKGTGARGNADIEIDCGKKEDEKAIRKEIQPGKYNRTGKYNRLELKKGK